ncbi:MAG: TfoX/Sxy family protein [Clostridiaceae bacterium]|nr:TfoX/Sxy family protein [Clostridiaceae bacterium]
MLKDAADMEFKDIICNMLKNAGDTQAKKMFGTYAICLDGINLGVLCVNKWYLKKTSAGDAFIAKNGMALETGIKNNSYIVTDFSNELQICELAKVTRDALKSKRPGT